ncbi:MULTISPECIES: hypothetical protein [Neomoorella]|uniref:Uncharacterized protein n=1 Tax=Neomoorella thermoacetica TaxID=1525 RepID=A0A1J5JT23_NEOTH|nr:MULTISPECIES: hypothetical protein [Moorella]OIQ07719.1 hypothetical protein MOOR_26730 [Moorella thermoacetica]OIQ10430.1 hypothetical protein MOOTH_26720 [Moorella thermoacetica]
MEENINSIRGKGIMVKSSRSPVVKKGKNGGSLRLRLPHITNYIKGTLGVAARMKSCHPYYYGLIFLRKLG